MKKLAVFLLLISSFTCLKAQIPNLVINPSFEDFDICPKIDPCRSMTQCKGWSENVLSYNNCNNGPRFTPWNCNYNKYSVYSPSPKLWPRTGIANITYRSFHDHVLYDQKLMLTWNYGKSYLNGQINQELVKGRPYYVSFYVRNYHVHKTNTNGFWEYSSYGINSMSAWIRRDTAKFGMFGGADPNEIDYLKVKPQINNPKNVFLVDTGAYQEVAGYFFASGGEKWITIGSFKPNYLVEYDTSVYYKEYDFSSSADYFFDDVTIVEHPYLGPDTCIKNGDSFLLEVPKYMGNPIGGYRWSNGSKNSRAIWVTKPGVYWVEMDAGYTTVRDSIVVNMANDTIKHGLKEIFRFCNAKEGELNLAVKNGQNYKWSNGTNGSTLRVNKPGIYEMSYKLSNGCTYKRTAEVWMPKVWIESPRPLFNRCDSQVNFLDMANNYLYAKGKYRAVHWRVFGDLTNGSVASTDTRNDGSNVDSLCLNKVFTDLYNNDRYKANIAILEAHDSGCVAYDTFHFYNFMAAQANLGPDYTLCASNGAVELKACTTMPVGKNTKVLWNTGSTDSIISIKQPGTYRVRTKGKFCSGRDTITIGIFDVGLNDSTLCKGTSFEADFEQLAFNPNIAKEEHCIWQKNGNIIDSLSGNYKPIFTTSATYGFRLNLLDSNLSPPLYCPNYCHTFTLFFDEITKVINDSAYACSDSFLIETLEPFDSILWSNNQTSPNTWAKAPYGNYSVKVARNGCRAHDSIYVADKRLNFSAPNDTTLCPFTSITLSIKPKGNEKVIWENEAQKNEYVATEYGAYNYQIYNKYCSQKGKTTLFRRTYKAIDLPETIDTTVCKDLPLQLTLTDSGQVWLPSNTKTIIIKKPGNKIVSVFNGCYEKDISVVTKWGICDSLFLFIPNAFSPNGDGLNDFFKPIVPVETTKYSFEIYNTFGQRIFKTEDINTGWDGSFKAKTCALDAYYYIIKLENKSQETIFNGVVNLLK